MTTKRESRSLWSGRFFHCLTRSRACFYDDGLRRDVSRQDAHTVETIN